MLNTGLYITTPSNSKLNAFGLFVLDVYNGWDRDFEVELTKGNGVTVIGKSTYSITLDITSFNEDFELYVTTNDGISFNWRGNTGYPNYAVLVDKSFSVNSTDRTVYIPYSLIGYTPNDVYFESEYQEIIPTRTKVSIGDVSEWQTIDSYINGETAVYAYKTSSSQPYNILAETDIPSYYIPQLIKNTSNEYQYIEFEFDDPTFESYIGYSYLPNVFIKRIYNDKANSRLVVTLSPNNTIKTRTQSFDLLVGKEGSEGEIEYDYIIPISITQGGNQNAYYFDYTNDNIPAIYDRTKTLEYESNIYIPSRFRLRVIDYDFNSNRIAHPYLLDYDLYSDVLNLKYNVSADDQDYLNKTDSQKMWIEIEVFEDDQFIMTEVMNLSINAPAMIYGSGDIYVDEYGKISGGLILEDNDATNFNFRSLPDWLKKDDFVFSDNKLILSRIGENIGEPRDVTLTVSFDRPDGLTRYTNNLTLKVSQDTSIKSKEDVNIYHKTFEDNIVKSSGYDEIVIKTGDRYIYSGYITDSINITDFTHSLFNDRINIFDNVLTNLDTLKMIEYSINGETTNEYYIYDNSFDEEDHFDITDICQPIDYYDIRQYVFESVYKYPGSPSDFQLIYADFGELVDYNKYNMTVDALSFPTMRLSYNIGEEKYYGKEYIRKCTNAEYAVYYMNRYCGWNWMLFNSNKQTNTETSNFSYMLNHNYEKVNYKVETEKRYNLTTDYITDEASSRLKDLYKSPIVYLHNLNSGEIIRVNINTKSYTEKSFINQGRKFFTQSIELVENKSKIIY